MDGVKPPPPHASRPVEALIAQLRRALEYAYKGDATHGAFCRLSMAEYVPSPFLTLNQLDTALLASRATPVETVDDSALPSAADVFGILEADPAVPLVLNAEEVTLAQLSTPAVPAEGIASQEQRYEWNTFWFTAAELVQLLDTHFKRADAAEAAHATVLRERDLCRSAMTRWSPSLANEPHFGRSLSVTEAIGLVDGDIMGLVHDAEGVHRKLDAAEAQLAAVAQVMGQMFMFARTAPSPQQTRTKTPREMVELFAQGLKAALSPRPSGDPKQEK